MKKIIAFLLILVLLSISIITINIIGYKNKMSRIILDNKEFEYYKDKVILGYDLTNIINLVVDKNTKNDVIKNDKGLFIDDGFNSIKIYIYMIDNENTYDAEEFYRNNFSDFIKFFGEEKFKLTNVEYHKKTKQIKKLYFEQQKYS